MTHTAYSVRMDETLKQQFEVGDEPLNEETAAALEEGEEMLRNPSKYKRYATFCEVMNEVLRDA